jgi:hypothetical protein
MDGLTSNPVRSKKQEFGFASGKAELLDLSFCRTIGLPVHGVSKAMSNPRLSTA